MDLCATPAVELARLIRARELSAAELLSAVLARITEASYGPSFDAPHVARLKQAGAVVIGKTNTPEFGAGSQTFNRVFGVSR